MIGDTECVPQRRACVKRIEWYVGEKKSFFQSKYDYYRKFNSQAIIIATVTSLFCVRLSAVW